MCDYYMCTHSSVRLSQAHPARETWSEERDDFLQSCLQPLQPQLLLGNGCFYAKNVMRFFFSCNDYFDKVFKVTDATEFDEVRASANFEIPHRKNPESSKRNCTI